MKPFTTQRGSGWRQWGNFYDFGSLSAGFEIEKADVTYCRSVGAGYVAVRTEYEQATYEQCAPQVRTAPRQAFD
jgi:hypothetical protein